MTEPSPHAAVVEHSLVGRAGAPVVLVLGGISATRHVAESARGGPRGWWPEIAGPGRVIDTERVRVIGIEYRDGGRAPDGRAAGAVTTHDQADAAAGVLHSLGTGRVHAAIGASYGGMVALALAERHPELLERVIVISAAHESSAMSTALRAIQRRIVDLGLEAGRAPDAMTLARALAMTTYRTAEELSARFPAGHADTNGVLAVERYLLHAARGYAERVAPHRFLALSLSADTHRVVPEQVPVRATVIAAEGDALVPAEQTTELAQRLPNLAAHRTLRSRVGHDAFLVEPANLAPLLNSALGELT